MEELQRIASHFRGKWLVANMLEGGGKTPLVPPQELHEMGFSMVFYPTSLVFCVTRALRAAFQGRSGRVPVEEGSTVLQMAPW